MQIGAVSFQPYVYNTNAVSASSLSKVAPIGNDLLAAKTDYSSLTDESLNENPLRKGQTANFMDVLDMQMQMSRMNASRIMKPAEDATQAVTALEESDTSALQAQTQQTSEATAAAQVPASQPMQINRAEATETFQPVASAEQADRNLYQMQRAAEAYQMYMTA